ncbi:hypothetical protein CEXT_604511 [Caerostris extrusa]|uniref:Uncharacterized protein n=1 Tax=Caerostris extrusa TaxID=172846 RepID=A0AAV4RD37_CAEEX|nr:hypothetical protein CEXT_604511 [Caerostris extrusa]
MHLAEHCFKNNLKGNHSPLKRITYVSQFMTPLPRRWSPTSLILISYGLEAPHTRQLALEIGCLPRRWNRTTLMLICYGFEARTPDHWCSSGRH